MRGEPTPRRPLDARAFAAFGVEKGVFVAAMGRFPAPRDWQLGFVATAAPAEQEFQLREIKAERLPAGRWATLRTRGNVDYLFRYWRKLRKWIEKDGLAVDGPVVEGYPDLLAADVAPDAVRGEVRYRIADGAGPAVAPPEPPSEAATSGSAVSP